MKYECQDLYILAFPASRDAPVCRIQKSPSLNIQWGQLCYGKLNQVT